MTLRGPQLISRSLPGKPSFAALLVLSLLWAATALKSDLLPNLAPRSLPYFASLAFPLFLTACTAFVRSRNARRPSMLQIRTAIFLGLTVFTFPAVFVHLSGAGISGSARTALFCLVPVFTAILRPHFGQNAAQPNGSILLAALVAILGALCIFPMDYPHSLQAALSFVSILLAVASIAAANCLAEAVGAQAETHVEFVNTAAMAAITAAISLAILSALLEQVLWPNIRASSSSVLPALLWSACIELPALLLFFWLVPRLSAIRLSTRYLLAPLLFILVGTALLGAEQQIQPRTWIGLALIAASAAWLLFAPEASAPPTTLFPQDREP